MSERDRFETWAKSAGVVIGSETGQWLWIVWKAALAAAKPTPEQKRKAFEAYVEHQYSGPSNEGYRGLLKTSPVFFEIWQGATQDTWYELTS